MPSWEQEISNISELCNRRELLVREQKREKNDLNGVENKITQLKRLFKVFIFYRSSKTEFRKLSKTNKYLRFLEQRPSLVKSVRPLVD